MSVPSTAEPAVSLEAARAHLNMSAQQSDGDTAELQRFIRAASRAAEKWLHRKLAPRDVVEEHDVGRDPVVFLRSRPVLSLDTIAVESGPPTAWATLVESGSRLDKDLGKLTVPHAANRHITVAFRAGMEPVLDDYETGVLMIVAHLWKTQRVPLGQRSRFGGGGPEDDSVMVAGSAVPRAALEMLGPAGVT